jgi:hypothetical protein
MINKNSDQIKILVLEGISLLNKGKFFEAHETLENAWHLEKAPIRALYQGLIQFSVACYHAERANWVGAGRVLQRARKNLTPFIHADSMIDVADVFLQIDSLEERIKRVVHSNVLDQEIVVSPRVKLKSSKDQEFIPGSG